MISQTELIQMHYEFAMTIGNSLDLRKMLRTSLKTLMRKMNCPAGGVHFFKAEQEETCRFEKILTIPRDTGDVQPYLKALTHMPDRMTAAQRKAFIADLPLSAKTEDGSFHIAELPGLGVVVLCRHTVLDTKIMKSLEPIFEKLAVACRACLQNEELLRHRGSLQDLVKEKTGELTRKNQMLIQEIEQRRHSEEALRQSEEKYRELVENANSIILRWDTEGRITFFNEYAQSFFGYSERDIIGQHVVGTIVPETESSGRDLRPLMEDICNNPQKHKYNVNENMRKDGSRVWVAWTNKVLTDDSGQFSGALSIGADITDRKQTEQALIESEARYKALHSNEIYAISIFDIETGQFVEANDAWLKLYGYRRDEIAGLKVADVSAEPETSQKAIKHSSQTGTVFIPERRHRKKNGDEFFVEISASPFAWKGRQLMYALIHDITERKASEDRLRKSEKLLAETQKLAQLGSWEFDVASEEIKWSEQTFRIAGSQPKDTLSLPEYLDTVHPDDLPMLQKTLEHASTAKTPYEIELRHRRPDGSYNYTLTRGKPIVEDGQIVKFIGSVLDLTDRKRLEEKLNNARRMEGIGTLAGGIAHQFNNALSGITGNIELIEMIFPDVENLSNYTQKMKAAAFRMSKLTSQLLAYARGGKYKVNTLSLTDLIKDTIPLVQHSIDASVKVEMVVPHDGINVRADQTQIQMVLSAIMINASEAMEGKGRIKVSCRRITLTHNASEDFPEHKPGDYACLTIADTGRGMDEETRSRIFEPFFTTKFEGRGLGLAAAYGIVKNHGGWISIDSESGKGSTFKIYLPSVESPDRKPDLQDTKAETGEGTILLIEDEKMVIEVVQPTLERLGYKVLIAETGQEAVDTVKKLGGKIHLALLDMVLPDMLGGVIYSRIKDECPDLKVIVSSGYSIDGPAQKILDAGADDFIQKPFVMADLSRVLKKVLGEHKQR